MSDYLEFSLITCVAILTMMFLCPIVYALGEKVARWIR